MRFSFPLLVSDIGGTHIRSGLARAPDAPLAEGPRLKTRDFPGLEAALAATAAAIGVKPKSLIACAAGPVEGRSVKMTNADWRIDGHSVAIAAGLEQGLLLNDFEAQAFSLVELDERFARPIGFFEKKPGLQLIMGLGTGLGTAALAKIDGRALVLPSEAGHMDLGPVGPQEEAFWPALDKTPRDRICVESLLSGHGLFRLHQARCKTAGKAARIADEVALIEQAAADPEGEEGETLRLCWTLTARIAGDLALAFLAKGGVTLAGGILPRILPFCDPDQFRATFENKAPYGQLLHAIGTRLITSEEAVLKGMAAIAAAPQNYAIDYGSRAWCEGGA
ncbi:MAG: glucokinase [Alphaproteobacteria bacterium]|nr:glucokinase [Alphaproteobacteria bacterium]